MTEAPIALTEAAAGRLAALSRAEGHPVMLRVTVEGGGCSGFQYRFDLVDSEGPDDLRVEACGQAALIDEMSLVLLKGAQIDYVDELAGAEFRVRNPNARSSCGCGVSFSI